MQPIESKNAPQEGTFD